MHRILYIAKELNLPSKDINSINEYLEHNECGIAFEVLCSAIVEENILVKSKQYEEIISIGNKMEIDNKLWENIEVN